MSEDTAKVDVTEEQVEFFRDQSAKLMMALDEAEKILMESGEAIGHPAIVFPAYVVMVADWLARLVPPDKWQEILEAMGNDIVIHAAESRKNYEADAAKAEATGAEVPNAS